MPESKICKVCEWEMIRNEGGEWFHPWPEAVFEHGRIMANARDGMYADEFPSDG